MGKCRIVSQKFGEYCQEGHRTEHFCLSRFMKGVINNFICLHPRKLGLLRNVHLQNYLLEDSNCLHWHMLEFQSLQNC
jgi:hypothetical protein